MNRFKEGDRIRVIRSPYAGQGRWAGCVGTVTHAWEDSDVMVKMDNDPGLIDLYFHDQEVEKLS